MITKTYNMQVWGCAMNISDAERIEAVMAKAGFKKNDEDPTILILVACSVRQAATDRVWGQINKFKKQNLKIKNKKRIIVLTGCILPANKKKFKKRVDLFIDINNIDNLPNQIQSFYNSKKTKVLKTDKPKTIKDYFQIEPERDSLFSALVPIMTGCNNFCAYCAVPYTRGREYSRPVKKIIDEVKKAIKQGYQEIILLGQNVNSYCGKNTQHKKINFPALLKLINDIPGEFWLRFITPHPKDLSDELIETMAKSKKICEQINLPVQAGDNVILKKMNRHYTIEHYKKLIRKIRQSIPGIAISTDVIVGFPGETKENFNNTAKLFREIKYDMAYIAEYSPRPNTMAANLKDNVKKEEKKRRFEKLTKILKASALENNKKYFNKELEALIEKCDENFYYGKTRTYKQVRIKVESKEIKKTAWLGQFVAIKIIHTKPWGMEGKFIV